MSYTLELYQYAHIQVVMIVSKILNIVFGNSAWFCTFAPGEMAERSIAAVLKTVDCKRSGGSNPSLSAIFVNAPAMAGVFCFMALLNLFRQKQ